MAVSDMSDLIDLIETELQTALDAEEKRLLEERELLKVVYEGVTGTSFSDKTSATLASSFTAAFITDLAVNVSDVVDADDLVGASFSSD